MIAATAMTHCGKVRARNEDTIVLPGLVSIGSMPAAVTFRYSTAGQPALFAVVDGMGGHHGGQDASRLVAATLLDHPQDDVADLLDRAHQSLFAEMHRSRHLLGMGATVAGVVTNESKATVFNVGDARVYRFSETYLMLLSTDDRVSPDSPAVTQSLGGSARPTSITPHIVELDVKDRERLLVCSDGLSAVVPFDAIQSALAEQPPERAVEHLLQSVMTAGAPDNVSILVLDYGDHR